MSRGSDTHTHRMVRWMNRLEKGEADGIHSFILRKALSWEERRNSPPLEKKAQDLALDFKDLQVWILSLKASVSLSE